MSLKKNFSNGAFGLLFAPPNHKKQPMKKIALFFAGVAFIAMATSCKKDYTCKCTVAGVATETPINDAKKKDAEDACDQLSSASAIFGGSCSLEKK